MWWMQNHQRPNQSGWSLYRLGTHGRLRLNNIFMTKTAPQSGSGLFFQNKNNFKVISDDNIKRIPGGQSIDIDKGYLICWDPYLIYSGWFSSCSWSSCSSVSFFAVVFPGSSRHSSKKFLLFCSSLPYFSQLAY